MKRFNIEMRLGQVVEPKKQHWLKYVLFILISILLLIALSVGVQIVLQKNVISDIGTWTSSLPSYWGGIIGGAISGAISFCGVFLTIKYYRDSDAAKSRIEHMPFIHVKAICANRLVEPSVGKVKRIEVPGRYYDIDKNRVMLVDLELENIGNGFANTLVVHLGNNIGGESYHRLIKVGEKEHLELEFYYDDIMHCIHNIQFSLQYVDCMTNEYIQTYSMECSNSAEIIIDKTATMSIIIESGYPRFIGQVHTIGK